MEEALLLTSGVRAGLLPERALHWVARESIGEKSWVPGLHTRALSTPRASVLVFAFMPGRLIAETPRDGAHVFILLTWIRSIPESAHSFSHSLAVRWISDKRVICTLLARSCLHPQQEVKLEERVHENQTDTCI